MTTGHEEIYVWILSGVLGFILTLFIIVATATSKNLGAKLNDLLASINKLIIVTTQQTEQIKALDNNNTATTHRLNDHASRLREIELNRKTACSKE